jgi:hypothetical protein
MAVKGFPEMAFAIAWRMAQVVNTVVGRARHVAIVNGLSRNTAATTYPFHLFALRGELKRREAPASPDSAIWYSALALSRSVMMYRIYANIGYVDGSGRREKSGRSKGAWW